MENISNDKIKIPTPERVRTALQPRGKAVPMPDVKLDVALTKLETYKLDIHDLLSTRGNVKQTLDKRHK